MANRFEIVLYLVPDLWKLIIQDKGKLLCLSHHVVNVRITMVSFYEPTNVLCWNYHKYSTKLIVSMASPIK